MQFTSIALAYAALAVVAAGFLYRRHLVELQDPAAASGGMAAFGDTLLGFFLAGLFLIPTVWLIWIIAKFEGPYRAYSQFLLGFSLSAPVCLSLLFLGERYVAPSLSWLSLFRIMGTPVVLVGMGFSRLVARFDRAKRLISYALLVEGLTLAIAVAIVLYGFLSG